MAVVATALMRHESLRCAQAAREALRGQRLIEDEVRAHLESLLQRGDAVHDGEADGLAVGWNAAHLLECLACSSNVVAIHEAGSQDRSQ